MNYILEAYRPYDTPDQLSYGTIDELKAFITKFRGEIVYRTAGGREIRSIAIAGYRLDDLTVYLEGPDIRDIIKEIEGEG